jgi:DNA-binding GntR family transcriptional regulator
VPTLIFYRQILGVQSRRRLVFNFPAATVQSQRLKCSICRAIFKGHGIILEAIEKMDEKTARDLMRRHLAITAAKLNAFYTERIEREFPGAVSRGMSR